MVVSIYLSSLRTSETESWSSSFRFHFLYPPPPRVEDRYMMKSFITRARHPIRKTRFFVPPKFYSLRIVDSEFLKYKLFFSIMVFLIFFNLSFCHNNPPPHSNCFPKLSKNVFFRCQATTEFVFDPTLVEFTVWFKIISEKNH